MLDPYHGTSPPGNTSREAISNIRGRRDHQTKMAPLYFFLGALCVLFPKEALAVLTALWLLCAWASRR